MRLPNCLLSAAASLILIATTASAAPAPSGTAENPAGPAAKAVIDPAAAHAEMRRCLAEKIDVNFEHTALDDVLKHIATSRPDVKIVIDPDIAKSGIDLSTIVVDLKMSGVAIEATLDLILGSSLGYRVEPGYILITTREKMQQSLPRVVYSVEKLLAAGPHKANRLSAYDGGIETIVDLVKRLVNAASDSGIAGWQEDGGVGSVDFLNGALRVTQTEQGHRRVAELLAYLDGAANRDQTGPMTAAPSEREKAIAAMRQLLARPIDLDVEKKGLDTVLKHIATTQRGLNIVFDPDIAAAGIDLSTTVVNAKVIHMPINVALDRILRSDLGYRVGPGYVMITPREKMSQQLPLATYRLAGLVGSAAKARAPNDWRWDPAAEYPQQILEIVKRTVNATSDPHVAVWQEEGGTASIEFWRGLAIVTQTERGHEEIGQLLSVLRAAVVVSAQLPPRPRGPVPTIVPSRSSPDTSGTTKALDTPIDVDFKNVPVMKALREILARPPQLSIIFGDCESWEKTVTCRWQGITRRQLLQTWFRSAEGTPATCVAEPDFVFITKPDDAHMQLQVAAYPVGDLLRAPQSDPSDPIWNVIRLIHTTVHAAADPNVASWSEEGGIGNVLFYRGVLVIQQTPRGHARISELLQNLRQTRGMGGR